MAEIKIISKSSQQTINTNSSQEITISDPSVVVAEINPENIIEIVREGNNAVVHLKSGESIVVENSNDITPSIVISALVAGETAKLYINEAEVDADYDEETGTLTPVNALDEGKYEISYSITDAAGNESDLSPVVEIEIDTTAPSDSQVIAITAISDDTGQSNQDFITNDNSLTIHGTLANVLEEDEFAQMSIDGGLTWSNLNVEDGEWSYFDDRELASGSYTNTVRVVDKAGNVGSNDSELVTVNTIGPDPDNLIIIRSISEDRGVSNSDFITSDQGLIIYGTITQALEVGELAQISVDDGTTPSAGSYYSGMVAADFDFDGDRDLMAFTTNSGTYFVENTDVNFSDANKGVIHLRILDQEGINALTVNLSLTSAQSTGYGVVTFKNIEGILGGGGADTFTGNASDNYFEGRGGDDTFNLQTGGQDTLIYKLL